MSNDTRKHDSPPNQPLKRRRITPPAKSREGHVISNAPLARWSLPFPNDDWSYREIATHEQIESLVDAYYAIVYPIIFHWPTFIANIRRRVYMTYPAFHALTMSVCALASARLRDGAPTSPNHRTAAAPNPLEADGAQPTSEQFYQAAVASFPRDLTKAMDFDYKRAKPLLATLAIQYGDIPSVHAHVGDYMTMCAIDGFHNECRWPCDLNEIEVQERRRLFWLAYQLDVYSATTWGGIIRHRESQSTVLYPTEVFSDEEITATGIVTSTSSNRPVSFLRGWNFTVDLYRILEHAVSRLRTRNHTFDAGNQIAAMFLDGRVGSHAELKPSELLVMVEKLYNDLPPELKGTSEMTGDVERDRYGFQAANILVTMQTVKMVVAGMADWSVEQRCAIACELLDAFATVPRAYIQAISTPLLHHLAGVGHLLASIIHSPLSPSGYMHVRNVLLCLADLLRSLESHLTSTNGIAPKLREHVERIDRYMANAAENGGKGIAATMAFNDQKNKHDLVPQIKPATNHTPFPLRNPASTAASKSAANPAATPPSSAGVLSSNGSTSQLPTPIPSFLSASLPPPFSGPNDLGLNKSQDLAVQPRREQLVYTPSAGSNTGSSTQSTPPQFSPAFNALPLNQSLHAQYQTSDHPPPLRPPSSRPSPSVARTITPGPLSNYFMLSPGGAPSQNDSKSQDDSKQALQLPNDLFVDWPFLFNEFGFQGDAFDFLSSGVGGQGGGGATSTAGASGTTSASVPRAATSITTPPVAEGLGNPPADTSLTDWDFLGLLPDGGQSGGTANSVQQQSGLGSNGLAAGIGRIPEVGFGQGISEQP
ncbi:hypothetical protein B9479_001722 [Cryptococcus floricola]|uniref:Xylanolytic transcriptional activator regulatory domain-containing protein n=1 Tax=Cryptococcus floricola TaxID=2591691 RepID=A0A5D3B605_9TREE|nr:hypothetical protein B9479_001722 [Cryptococcus floricola]